ncbi:MAG: hypothetical protein LBS87_02490 [Puniceicoccales bacterium]|jgi:hypothetical protein|nr:hypothetical protein [Puniceicoccales bacterium]
MVEAIESISKDKEDQTNNFEKYIELVRAQNIQSNLPAGMIETPVKPPATSVSETMEDLNVKDSRSCSLENPAESISGRLVATSTPDSKREALAVDQQQLSINTLTRTTEWMMIMTALKTASTKIQKTDKQFQGKLPTKGLSR